MKKASTNSNCTCDRLEHYSNLFTEIFKESIVFIDIECPIHGSLKHKTKSNKKDKGTDYENNC